MSSYSKKKLTIFKIMVSFGSNRDTFFLRLEMKKKMNDTSFIIQSKYYDEFLKKLLGKLIGVHNIYGNNCYLDNNGRGK